MKKLLCALFVMLLAIACLTPACAQSSQRKLTLMVYMCGSNLESSYGSASADLQEMIAAAPGMKDVSVLIMNGGSSHWSTGYDASQLQISELGKRGVRVVWRAETASMGVPETLTHLLQFGVEKYPAQEYALILWDHGGGPLEGVCWDELFSMDNLRLSELTEALQAAPLPGKLSWIGFDACLMSSLEVAGAMAPYAEYMIASQETEPAHGWNYAFLAGLGDDQSGADTGRRIVDAYFEGREDTQDVLTLACLDLSRAEAASQAVDAFFSQAGTMNHELFNAVSGVRMNATGFGKGLRGLNDNGYDLVDLTDLTQRLAPLMADAAPLQLALDEMICYSRANIGDAGGISIYHPYMNKNKYLTGWKDDYAQLSLSPEYADYIGQFGAWLTGEALADWAGLCPTSLGFDMNGKEQIALQLSDAQAADFASAQMLILKEFSLEDRIVSLVGTVPAQMDGNGLVTGTADWYNLYIMDSMGDLGGPLAYMMTPEASQMVTTAALYGDKETLGLLYYMDMPTAAGEAAISQVRVRDKATGTYTNRISVNMEDYDSLFLVDTFRKMPESDGLSELPDFYSWEQDFTGFSGYSLDPSLEWSLLWRNEILTNDVLYAVFSITDTQQNTYCSQPILLQNPHIRPFTASLEHIDTQDFTAEMSGYVSAAENDAGLQLDVKITNMTGQAIKVAPDSVILNGTRYVTRMYSDDFQNCTVEPHSTGTASLTIGAGQLLGLEQITDVVFTLDYYPDASTYHSSLLDVTFRLDRCSVADILPELPVLAQGGEDGLSWQVLSIAPSELTGFEMLVIAQNQTDAEIDLGGQVLINGVGCETSYLSEDVPAGCSIVREALVHNDLFTGTGFSVADAGLDWIGPMLSRHILQGYGIDSIGELTFLNVDEYDGKILHSATLPLSAPVPVTSSLEVSSAGFFTIPRLPDGEKLSLDRLITLVEHPDVSVRLERIMVGTYNIALALHLTNHSDAVQTVDLDEVVISGAEYSHYGADETFVLAPHATTVSCAILGADLYGTPKTEAVNSLDFVVSGSFSQDTFPIRIAMKEAAPYAASGGCYILPEDMTRDELQPQAVATPVPEQQAPTAVFMDNILLPENARQYQRHFSVQLTPEQAAQAKTLRMFVVREAPSGNLDVVHYQRAFLQEDNTLTADTMGMLLSVEGLPDVLVPSFQATSVTGDVLIYNTMTINATSMTDYVSSLSVIGDMGIILDYDANQAVFDYVKMSRDPLPEKQGDIVFVRIPTYEVVGSLADSALPYVGDLAQNTDDAWFDGLPVIWPNGAPIQLSLRPITAEDHLYVMFSVKNTDGTGYTLPAIPFLPEGAE